MKRMRLPDSQIRLESRFRPALGVIEYISTKRGDPERGPMIRLSPADAKIRLLTAGELAWVEGPRRNELAIVEIDDAVPDGSAVVRDIAGVALTERVVVTKPDLDTPLRGKTVG
jgi:anaerobic selenocysteine-containing dehydrogenase